MNKLIIYGFTFMLFIACVTGSSIFMDITEYNELSNETIISGSEPYISQVNIIEYNDYEVILSYLSVSLWNYTTLKISVENRPYVVYNSHLNFCYDHYTPALCNEFFLTYITPLDLRSYGYNGSNFMLFPIGYYKYYLWLDNYMQNIQYKNLNLTNNYGGMFGPEDPNTF